MPYILKKYYPLRNIVFFLGEGFLIFLAISSVYLFYTGSIFFFDGILLYAIRALLVTITFQLCLYYFDIYDLSTIPSFSDTATRVTQAFGFGCIALAVLYYFFPVIIISTKIFWTGYVVICAVITIWRFFYAIILARRMFSQSVLLIGTGTLADNISLAIENKQDSGYKISALIGETPPNINPRNIPVFQKADNLLLLCNKYKTEKIIIALDDKRGKMPVPELMSCKIHGIPIVTGINFYERLTGKIMVEKVNPSWIIYSEGFKQSRVGRFWKRLLDLIVSVAGLVLSMPLIVASALFIKLESPGTIFYNQKRVGEKGRNFNVIKFRSMRSDAEKDGPVWAAQKDNRVTRYGSFMRKTRIDEIPQMWNVLKGDMSFVGPRPERPVFVRELEAKIPYYSLRHIIKPGITGWAQVFYPYGASEEDALRKLEYDLYYIKNLTLFMDLWIIFQTIKIILFQKGSR